MLLLIFCNNGGWWLLFMLSKVKVDFYVCMCVCVVCDSDSEGEKKKETDSWVRMLVWRNGLALIISDYFNPLEEANALENHVIFTF